MENEHTVEELSEKYRNGTQSEAFEAIGILIFKTKFNDYFAAAFKRTKDSDTAHQILTDTAVSMRDYDVSRRAGLKNVAGYAYRIICNKGVDAFKKKKKERGPELKSEDLSDTRDIESAEVKFIANLPAEALKFVTPCTKTALKSGEYEIFNLIFQDENNHTAVAKELNISSLDLTRTLSKMKRRLRTCILKKLAKSEYSPINYRK